MEEISDEIRFRIIGEYLEGLRKNQVPPVICGESGFATLTAPKKPKTVKEAAEMWVRG